MAYTCTSVAFTTSFLPFLFDIRPMHNGGHERALSLFPQVAPSNRHPMMSLYWRFDNLSSVAGSNSDAAPTDYVTSHGCRPTVGWSVSYHALFSNSLQWTLGLHRAMSIQNIKLVLETKLVMPYNTATSAFQNTKADNFQRTKFAIKMKQLAL